MLGIFRQRNPAKSANDGPPPSLSPLLSPSPAQSSTTDASPDNLSKSPRPLTVSTSTSASDSASTDSTMAMSAVDVFFLTFNCAKNFVDVPVFATHLLSALRQRSAPGGLPDLVAFSLQEIAPIAYSFIGPYFLNPYLARYEDALNLAADAFNNPTGHDDRSPLPLPGKLRTSPPAYTLVRSKNVGMTAILLFARDPLAVVDVQEAEVGFGAAEMGNKGAAGLRVLYEARDGAGSAELTFVATHLAAMEWNLARRNANWAAIMRGLTFENPEKILKPKVVAATSAEDDGEGGTGLEEVVRLLHDRHIEESRQMQERLHDISVFKPSSHLFVAGDLNYRISATSPTPNANFPSLDPESENYYPHFFPLDQLTREREAGRTLNGLSEARVDFPPTYKYDITPPSSSESNNPLEVSWKFAPHRYPSWTDRVLYLDIPPWTKALRPEARGIEVQAYNAMPVVASSDHRAVFLRVDVPVMDKEDLLLPRQDSHAEYPAEWDLDPRAKMPVAIDPEAWERRAAARQKEVMAGWSMLLGSTQEGALIVGTLALVAVSAWYLYQQWY
ncbi:related to phosphatidylinositol phosphate phosphatase [Cephalotrichum gorgonifer]|uniref:Related to phosphatidylinositol phosphate phosphatase n=1 Tax=Cephalotrichum gorgonifer TaxID=2041049 RepID=A0AAE8MTN2_9PEZI|nr:related to phosphatidylinositol phosphate phosphatase [Cephalotrichum gorgonifer]